MTTRRAPSRIIPRAFPGITPQEIEELIINSQVHSYEPGAVLCRENAVEDRFYMILDGEVEVTKNINKTESRLLQTLSPGDFFGEMSLLDNEPRSADVTSTQQTWLLSIGRDECRLMLRDNPVLGAKMLWAFCQILNSRLRNANRELVSSFSGVAATPANSAATATPWAWLPALMATTPRRFSSSLSWTSLLQAPRSLKEAVNCRFSNFR